MPKGIPPIGKRFQKGQVANPLGAGANPLKTKIKKLTTTELETILNEILLAKDLSGADETDLNNLHRWVRAIVQKGIEKGDPSALFALLDRMIGKVTDKVKVTSTSEQPKVVVYLPSNGREAKEQNNES